MADPTPGTELIGRGPELAQVDECLARAAAGVTTSLLIGGDAGMGKTSLMRAGTSRAAAAGFEVLIEHCLDIEAGIPFGPFLEAVRPLLLNRGDDESRPVARRVTALLDPSQRSLWEPASAL